MPATLASDQAAPSVAVIVPARDESANIEACVQTLLAQEYPPERCTVVVVDDRSADGTPQIVGASSARVATGIVERQRALITPKRSHQTAKQSPALANLRGHLPGSWLVPHHESH